MGFSHIARKEDLLESLVGGACLNCSVADVNVNEFLVGTTLYTRITCNRCKHEEILQVNRGDHLTNKHLF